MTGIEVLPEITLNEDGKLYNADGTDYLRVTSIIDKVLPPYLAPWAEGVGLNAAWEIFQRGGRPNSLAELKQLVREAGLTCEDEKVAGGERGAALHLAIEAMIRTGEPSVDLNDFEDPEHALYAQSFAQWMLDYNPVFEEAEVRIVHPELGYAGTFDAIGVCRSRPKGARGLDLTGKRVLFDFKTNKEAKVYEQHLYQLAGYHLACDYYGIEVEGSAVVALGPMGQVKKKVPYTFKANHVEPEAFRGVVDFYNLTRAQAALNPLARKAK